MSKLIDGKFPDYTRVIPTGHKNQLQIEREPLRQALQRAAILSNEKFRGVRWVLGDGSLKIVVVRTPSRKRRTRSSRSSTRATRSTSASTSTTCSTC